MPRCLVAVLPSPQGRTAYRGTTTPNGVIASSGHMAPSPVVFPVPIRAQHFRPISGEKEGVWPINDVPCVTGKRHAQLILFPLALRLASSRSSLCQGKGSSPCPVSSAESSARRKASSLMCGTTFGQKKNAPSPSISRRRKGSIVGWASSPQRVGDAWRIRGSSGLLCELLQGGPGDAPAAAPPWCAHWA